MRVTVNAPIFEIEMKPDMGKKLWIISLAGSMILAACAGSKKTSGGDQEILCGFYNVENLFDTIDDPVTMDEDFTPGGKLQWNTARYQTKLDHIAAVMDAMPGSLPVIMGFCEIENASVLHDLVKHPMLSDAAYEVVHRDSPDERGIDVALIYRTSVLTLISTEAIRIKLTDEKDPNTRDILYAKMKCGNDELHFFINHWPSRRGGETESEVHRLTAAAALRAKTDSIFKTDEKAKILIMGDFNDYPTNRSISEILGAGGDNSKAFFDFMLDDHLAKRGTHYYQGEWGALDQIIVSRGMMDNKSGCNLSQEDVAIFNSELVMFKDKEGNLRPNRTYVGDKYVGGYSDHLPVFARIHCH